MYKNIATQSLHKPLHKTMGITVEVLRLDIIHPVISGNKWFKLKYHIQAALNDNKKGIVTFGGAYSNHLAATAVACSEKNLSSVGIIRGEQTFPENESIKIMRDAGMHLIYLGRDQYKNKNRVINEFLSSNNGFHYVPEGGQSAEGIKGAGEILMNAGKDYSHIICSTGTGTTLAGLINSSSDQQNVIGISALKIPDTDSNELITFLKSNTTKNNYTIFYDYHFGGYARKTNELIAFMNSFYAEENIPTDFVYTGKMIYAVYNLIQKNYFLPGSKLLLIHTGGLLGNSSLPSGMLVF